MYQQFFQVQTTHWWFATRKKIVLDTIQNFCNRSRDRTILDVGCGCGVMLDALGELGDTSALDMSDEAIDFCKKTFSGIVKNGFLPNQIPFQNGSFDLITALDVIEHIDEDEESLTKIYDLLKPGGQTIVTVPAYQFLWSKFDDINEHKRRYTLSELRNKLKSSGFEIEKISYFNTLLFPVIFIVRTANKVLGRDGASDIELPKAFTNSILKKIFGLEIPLLRQLNLPFGVSIIAVGRKPTFAFSNNQLDTQHDETNL